MRAEHAGVTARIRTLEAVTLAIAALGSVAACTLHDNGTAPSSARPRPMEPAPAVTLTCSEATSGSDDASADDVTIGPVSVEGARVTARAERATASGIRTSGRSDLYFRKLPLRVRGSSRVTITAGSPGVYLSWVPARIWTTGSGADIAPWLARRVTVTSCPGVTNSYFLGGVASTSPTCWSIDVLTGSAQPSAVLIGSQSDCRVKTGR